MNPARSTGPAGGGREAPGRRGRILVSLLCLLATAGCSREEGEAGAAPVTGTEVGQSAPDLGGTTSSGEPFALRDETGAPTVLVFYQGAYCGLCRERLLRLQEHLPAYRALEARVVAVAPDPPAQGAELVRALGLEFPVVSVDSATLALWGVAEPGRSGTRPASYVLDSGGVVLFRHLGRNAGDRVGDATLITLLEGRNRE